MSTNKEQPGGVPDGKTAPPVKPLFDPVQRLELRSTVAAPIINGAYDGEGRQMRSNDEVALDIAQLAGMLMSREIDEYMLWTAQHYEEAAADSSIANVQKRKAVDNLRLKEREEEAKVLSRVFPREGDQ